MTIIKRVGVGVLVSACLAWGGSSVIAQEDADGLRFGYSSLAPAAGVTISVPTSVQRGNVAQISVSYPSLTVPLNSICILVLPVNSAAYQETILYSRKYPAVGVSGHACPMFIPDFVQFSGMATVIAIVDGAGVGTATFTVTP
jgi:hypothetical protein